MLNAQHRTICKCMTPEVDNTLYLYLHDWAYINVFTYVTLSARISLLLPFGSEQNEVLHVVSIPTGILLHCPQTSRSFFLWLNASLYKNNPPSPGTGETIAGSRRAAFLSIKTVKVVGYQRIYANETGDLDL